MPFLSHLWREWIADNPFLMQELRRWGRRKRRDPMARVTRLFAIVALAFIPIQVAFFSFLMHRRSGATGNWLTWGLPQLLPTAMAVYLLYVVFTKGGRFSLGREATAGRLDFIRLSPMAAREVIGKTAVTRAVLSLRPALIGLPIYVLLLPYSDLSLLDVLLFFAAMLLLCLGPPGPFEVSGALGTTDDIDLPQAPRAGDDSSSSASSSVLSYLVIMVMLAATSRSTSGQVGALIGPLFAPVGRLLSWLAPWPSLFHLLLGGGLVHFVCDPQPFFRWSLTPAWIFFIWWPLSFRRRLIAGAAAWREGPLEVPPRAPDHDPAEVRRMSRLGEAATALLGLAALGYLWPPLVLSGGLGKLIGTPTAPGAAAALLALVAAVVAPVLLETNRHQWSVPGPDAKRPSLWRKARSWALLFGVALAGVLGICLVGWVSPWPHALGMLGRIGLVVVAVMLFAFGWRAALSAPPQPDSQPSVPSAWRILRALAAVGLYVLPWAVLAYAPTDVRWHALAALSPNYAALSLLPGLWPAPPLLPFAAATTLPGGLGLMLLLLRRQPRAIKAATPEKPIEPTEDVLQERLRQWANRYDNPILTLAVREIARGRSTLSARLGRGVVISLVYSALLLSLVIGYEPKLWGPAGSIAILLLSGISLATTMEGAVRTEHTVAREERRLVFVLASRLSDREIVCGVLTSAGLNAGITTLSGIVVALLWCLLGIATGTPWWWLFVWACLLFGVLGLSLQAALIQFVSWHPRWRLSVTGWQLLSIAMLILGGIGILAAVDMALGGIPRLPIAVPHVLALAAPVAVLMQAVTLRLAFRSAAAAVGAHRTQDDLA